MNRLLFGLLLLFEPAFCQRSPQTNFEVASVKPVEEPRGVIGGFSSSGPRVRYAAYPTIQLIREAYNLKDYDVTFARGVEPPPPTGGPYEYALYDIDAKAEGDRPLTRDEFRPMLRTLLAERFNLRVHRESREIPVYALVVGKSGVKFKASDPAATERTLVGVNGRNQNITAKKASMDDLAGLIQNAFGVDRPVVNRTELAGMYEFKLEATPEFRMNTENPGPTEISVFTAIQSQLGLKLEPQKAPREMLIVDHVEKPSAN
jgi:uncharacterized protein (TIGR03435 family)